jgi:hypothetical protein
MPHFNHASLQNATPSQEIYSHELQQLQLVRFAKLDARNIGGNVILRSLLGLDGVHEVTEGDIPAQILAWP